MANIKFSQFTQKTTLGTVDFLVGYTGAQNIQIDPADLLSDYSQGTGAAGQVTFFSAASTVTGDNDFYWDNTNKRLGIGTATPGNKLEVQVTSNGHGVLFKSNATQIGSILRTAIGGTVSMTIDGAGTRPININNSSSSNVLIANGGGNVGIGTTSPVAKLQVEGSFISGGISQLGTTGANVLLTSSSAGNVGIGTSGPSTKLHVAGIIQSVESGNAAFYGGDYIRVFNNQNFRFRNSGGTVVANIGMSGNSYFNGGNVGIGTSSPGVPLDVFGSDGIRTATNSGALAAGYFARLHSDYGSNALRLKSRAGDVFRATDFGQAVSILTGTTSSGTSERMRITSGGNVGIGTSTPSTLLHIAGANPEFRMTDTSNINYNSIKNVDGNMILSADTGNQFGNSRIRFEVDGSEKMRLNTNGDLGIGTTSPSTKLDIVTDSAGSQIELTSPTPGLKLIDSNLTTRYAEIKAENGNVNIDIDPGQAEGTSYFSIDIDNSEKFRITKNGDVGIGTVSPGVKLDVNGVIRAVAGDVTTSDYSITSNGGDLVLKAGADDIVLRTGGSGTEGIYFQDSAQNTKMFINAENGNVGIGTTSPSDKLEINGGSDNAFIQITTPNTNYAGIRFGDPQSINAGRIQYYHGAGSLEFDAEVRFAFQGGNVGIGTDNPASKLEVDGGDIEVDDSASGLILRSPDGTRYRVTVANGGTLSVSAV